MRYFVAGIVVFAAIGIFDNSMLPLALANGSRFGNEPALAKQFGPKPGSQTGKRSSKDRGISQDVAAVHTIIAAVTNFVAQCGAFFQKS